MRFRFEKPVWRIGFLLGLLGLLITLATLQYRWLGQVSVGERERMRASLASGAEHFSQDFNREISRPFLLFQLTIASPEQDVSKSLSERYDRWLKSAPNPSLITDLYFVSFNDERKVVWQHFDTASRRLTPADVPADLATLDQKLSDSVKIENRPEDAPPVVIDPIQADIPLLLAPAVILPDDTAGPAPTPTHRLFNTDYVAIRLNREFITANLLPTLAQKYFKGSDGLDYSVTVIAADSPQNVVFTTGTPTQGNSAPAGDATVKLFDLQMDGLANLEFTNTRIPAPAGKGDAIFLSHTKREVDHEIPAPTSAGTGGGPSERGRNVVVRVFSKDVTTGFQLRKLNGDSERHWQLIARHRSGSLDTYIASTRRRSLGISFGVLLLLAASVGFVLLAARRSQRLAQRQLEFVSSVSHEFRTPLAVICSAGENLADGIVHSPAQIEKYGSLIRGEGRRLTEMVEQVLEFAGVQSGRKTYHRADVEVADLIDEALVASSSVITAANITVDRSVANGIPRVSVDAMAMRQSLQNLIGNAVKYGAEGGWIGISAKFISGGRSEVEISVADRGRGIAEADRKHLFEPFYRGAEVVAAQIHGNGLGLSLVQRVVEAHQGRITVDSTPGKGSTFTIHLPVRSTRQGELATAPARVPITHA